jgi:hypothetical protein
MRAISKRIRDLAETTVEITLDEIDRVNTLSGLAVAYLLREHGYAAVMHNGKRTLFILKDAPREFRVTTLPTVKASEMAIGDIAYVASEGVYVACTNRDGTRCLESIPLERLTRPHAAIPVMIDDLEETGA